MQTEYDISRAFKRVENDLIRSMMKNLERHKAEELKEGFDWEQWQAIQLRELEKYRIKNRLKFNKEFDDINEEIERLYRFTAQNAQTKQEAKLLKKILDNDISPTQDGDVTFFGINEGRLNALIEATKADFDKAEQSVLRKSEDIYRQVIFDAQVKAATGATYEQAVDMATKDFLRRGIQSIVYKNGSRHSISEYSRMALKTGQKRAYLMGEGNANAKYGVHTVRVNMRTHACPKCVRFLGRVLVDDVYSGGTLKEAEELNVPTVSQAMEVGFLHPNCKDIYSVYFPGISKPAREWTEPEIRQIVNRYNDEQALNNAENTLESYKRLATYSLFPANQQFYANKVTQWEGKVDALKEISQYGLQHRPGNPLKYPDEVMTADKIANGEIFPTDFLKNASTYLPDVDEHGGRNVVEILKSVQGKPDAEVTIYRGAPSGGVLNQGDWVTLSEEYAMEYAYGNAYSDNAASKVFAYKVRAGDLSFDGDSIHEFGYWGERLENGIEVKLKQSRPFTPANTIKEAAAYAESLGVDKVYYKGLDLETANTLNESLQRGIELCPDIKQHLRAVGNGQAINKDVKKSLIDWYSRTDPDGWIKNTRSKGYTQEQIDREIKKWANGTVGNFQKKVAASTRIVPDGNRLKDAMEAYDGLYLNSNLLSNDLDKRKFLLDLKASVFTKFSPEGCDTIKSVVDHEIGHLLDYTLDLRFNKEIIELYNNMTKEEIKNQLCEYANENIKEFIAEAWAEYTNNPKPRAIAMRIGEIVEEATR